MILLNSVSESQNSTPTPALTSTTCSRYRDRFLLHEFPFSSLFCHARFVSTFEIDYVYFGKRPRLALNRDAFVSFSDALSSLLDSH